MSANQQVFGTGLSHRIAVYVPSTTQVELELTADEHEHWVRTSLRTLSALFGGATALSAHGGWVTDQGNLVVETVTVVYSFAGDFSVSQLQAVRQLAAAIRETLGQEAVAVEIDGELFFV